MDIISNLPMEVIDAILIRIPLKDAVRTSILSSKWRDKWVTMSQLVVDGNSCLPHDFEGDDQVTMSKFVSTVDKLLLRHQGSLQKFAVRFYMHNFSDVDQWIIYLSRKGVKKLIIDGDGYSYDEPNMYEISSRIYTCQELSRLKLCFCDIKPLPSFQFFPNLKSLTLLWCSCDISYLISKCPLLERLTFEPCSVTSIEINAPNLKFLNLFGEMITSVRLESTPLLSEIFFGSFNNYYEWSRVTAEYTLVRSLWHLPKIRNINLGSSSSLDLIGCTFVESREFSSRCKGWRLPTSLYNLETLKVQLDFTHRDSIVALLCLLRSSPRLQKLSWKHKNWYFSEGSDVEEESWEAGKNWNCSLSNLREVHITEVVGLAPEMEFIKVVLANSPALRNMIINTSTEDAKILKGLLRLRRASAEAEIVWLPSISPPSVWI